MISSLYGGSFNSALDLRLATLHLPKECADLRDVSLDLRRMRLYRLVIRSVPLISSFYEASQIERLLIAWRNETDAHLLDGFLGYQNMLRAPVPFPYIKREDKK